LSDIKAFVAHVCQQHAVVSRQLLVAFADEFKVRRKEKTGDKVLEAVESCIDIIKGESSTSLFDEVLSSLYYNIALTYQHDMEGKDEDNFIKAARYLQRINFENSNQKYSCKKKVKVWVLASQLYLAESMFDEAESMVKRSQLLINDPEVPQTLKLMFWSSMAQVQDANQKFHFAATGYLRLSEQIINQEESLEKLDKGMRCTALSVAGPIRSRLLAKCYKDERSRTLPAYKLIEKMLLERFIVKSDYENLVLEEHQTRVVGKEGWTLLQKAIVEHNIIAVSKLYTCISITDLSAILDLTAEKAESTAATMISENRLTGSIDQSKGMLHFVPVHVIKIWDKNIELACLSVNSAFDKIVDSNQEWASKQLSGFNMQ